jgi:acetyltransferase-like isoleucine patch superfamily enzyme
MANNTTIKSILKLVLLPKACINILVNYAFLRANNVSMRSFPDIKGTLFIRNKGCMQLGNGIRINSSLISNPIGGSTKTCLITYSTTARLIIGDKVFMSNAAIVANTEIIIEDNVYIGASVKIYDTDFHSVYWDNRILGAKDPDIQSKPVTIKKYAFIGAHSIVLKGVTIGQGAVIGAGSVITRDVGAFEIWGGNPARCIRKIPQSHEISSSES